MKMARIKGGIYKGKYWRDFYSNPYAKKIAHKQERKRGVRFIEQYI